MTLATAFNLLIFAIILSVLFNLARRETALSRRVLAGLVVGAVFGLFLQLVYGGNAAVMGETLEWTNVVANGYVNLLLMIIMPLILITMIAAVLRVEEIRSLGTIGGSVVGLLIMTTMIAALVGIAMALLFGLNAGELVAGARELARAEALAARQGSIADLSIAQLLVSFIPSNIFADLTGARSTSIISVVIWFLGTMRAMD